MSWLELPIHRTLKRKRGMIFQFDEDLAVAARPIIYPGKNLLAPESVADKVQDPKVSLPVHQSESHVSENVFQGQTSGPLQCPRPTLALPMPMVGPFSLLSNNEPANPVDVFCAIIQAERLSMLPRPVHPELPLLRTEDIRHWIDQTEASYARETVRRKHPGKLSLQKLVYRLHLAGLLAEVRETSIRLFANLGSGGELMDRHHFKGSVSSLDVELDEQELKERELPVVDWEQMSTSSGGDPLGFLEEHETAH